MTSRNKERGEKAYINVIQNFPEAKAYLFYY